MLTFIPKDPTDLCFDITPCTFLQTTGCKSPTFISVVVTSQSKAILVRFKFFVLVYGSNHFYHMK